LTYVLKLALYFSGYKKAMNMKLTLSLDRSIIEKAKEYARKREKAFQI